MQENVNGGCSGGGSSATRQVQQPQPRVAPVRRARSCHYDLRKRVLINNFLKDQRELRIPSEVCSFVANESSAASNSNNTNSLEVLNGSLIGSDDSPGSENEPPKRTRNAFHRRVNVRGSPVATTRCTRSRSPNILRQPSTHTSHTEPVIVDQNPVISIPSSSTDNTEHGYFQNSYNHVATVITSPQYTSAPFNSLHQTTRIVHVDRDDHVVRAGIRRPVKRLASSVYCTPRSYVTYEYPPYKTVIPAMHTDHRVLRSSTASSSTQSLQSGHRSPKRRVPSFKRRKLGTAGRSPPPHTNRASTGVFKKQRGRIQRRSSIRKALVRLLSQEKRSPRVPVEAAATNRKKSSTISATKEKLGKSILDTLFNWTKPATGLKSTPSAVQHTRETPRRSAACDVVTVVRSHSVHVPRRSCTGVPHADAKQKALRRKSMSASDCRALRALSNGDNGFN